MENYFDYGDVGNFRDTDVYMRITTANIANNGVFYTDQNGKKLFLTRLKVNKYVAEGLQF